MPNRFRGTCCFFAFCATLILGEWSVCRAGGGPENVFVVVNSEVPDSKTIANYYCQLRNIPGVNVLQLPWAPKPIMKVDQFRNQFLPVIFNAIADRKLENQIDYIVYSAGFPYAVNIEPDVDGTPNAQIGPLGSLTGMTYLYQLVQNKDRTYYQWMTEREAPGQVIRTNYYASVDPRMLLTRGFEGRRAWLANGQADSLPGLKTRSYMLSTMLGYTAGNRGNSLEEVISYLQRSALADGTKPSGTIYLEQNEDVRSTTRHAVFPLVVEGLSQLGVKAEIEERIVPYKKKDVMGTVVGKATFDWGKYLNRIMPGAICEHLTSFGGVLQNGGGGNQTPLTEFLRYGAAGASGTVTEPYALQPKFPHPFIHIHYARGCSLAEAFYQSVSSPYQLLIVGDPLCRPWANLPVVSLDGIRPNDRVGGTVSVTPQADSSVSVQMFRLYVDGRLIGDIRPGQAFDMDTTKLADGYHELRVVGIEASAIESQGRAIVPFHVANADHKMTCELDSDSPTLGSQVTLQVTAPGARTVVVYHGRLPLAAMKRSRGTITIDTKHLGMGPVELTVVASNSKGNPSDVWYSEPVRLHVYPPPLLPASVASP
ncbi:MAG: TIGR03790 family protein [Planctomycetales bacterium]|nr:TIGR03790 family protein [Planctomycetales bacterium]